MTAPTLFSESKPPAQKQSAQQQSTQKQSAQKQSAQKQSAPQRSEAQQLELGQTAQTRNATSSTQFGRANLKLLVFSDSPSRVQTRRLRPPQQPQRARRDTQLRLLEVSDKQGEMLVLDDAARRRLRLAINHMKSNQARRKQRSVGGWNDSA